jgi:hypothetical protein
LDHGSKPGICNIFVHKPIETANLTIDDADALRDKRTQHHQPKISIIMTIDSETVDKIAHLARLELAETEKTGNDWRHEQDIELYGKAERDRYLGS